MNPDLDLTLERVIRAPRAAVWSAWTDPSRFEKWWVPAPALCRGRDPAARARHHELGFADGWGSVTKQLAEVAESQGP